MPDLIFYPEQKNSEETLVIILVAGLVDYSELPEVFCFCFLFLATVLIFAFDIKIENIFHFIKNMFASDAESKIKIVKKEEEETSNLEKIKKLGKEKKKPCWCCS